MIRICYKGQLFNCFKLAGGGGGGGGVDVLAPLVLLAPLAGLASLYAAAAVNSNSALITLAVLNNNGGRKKRSLDLANEAEEELTASMNFMNEHRVNGTDLAHRLLVNHLTCNNLFEDYCLAKIGCLLAAERLHADQTKLILLELLRNPYLNDESKENILMGYKSTPADKNACLNFPCKL